MCRKQLHDSEVLPGGAQANLGGRVRSATIEKFFAGIGRSEEPGKLRSAKSPRLAQRVNCRQLDPGSVAKDKCNSSLQVARFGPRKASLAKPAAGSKGKTNEIAVTAASGSPVAAAEMLEAASERAPALGNALSKDEPVRSDWQTLLVSTNILWSGGSWFCTTVPAVKRTTRRRARGILWPQLPKRAP